MAMDGPATVAAPCYSLPMNDLRWRDDRAGLEEIG